MKRALMVAAVLMAGCGGEDLPPWPDVAELYSLDGDTVTCSDTWGMEQTEVETRCSWREVIHEGRPACWAVATFLRDAPGQPWALYGVTASDATCWD